MDRRPLDHGSELPGLLRHVPGDALDPGCRGLVVKGLAFGGAAGLMACHEGLARSSSPGHAPEAICSAACRAAYLAGLAVLVFNAAWFLLVYHAGPAFGPTVLVPPNG